MIEIKYCYSEETRMPFRKKNNYLSKNSQGLSPLYFLKAVEKCEIEEYPSKTETSVTLNHFSYNKYLACSIRWLW